MNAVISGRVGVALLLDGERLSSFDIEEPDCTVPRNRHDLPFLLGESSDLRYLEDITHEQARAALEQEYNSTLALDLALILLDPEYSDPEVATELDELLTDFRVLERPEKIMYPVPLPPSADLKRAKQACEISISLRVGAFLQRFQQNRRG